MCSCAERGCSFATTITSLFVPWPSLACYEECDQALSVCSRDGIFPSARQICSWENLCHLSSLMTGGGLCQSPSWSPCFFYQCLLGPMWPLFLGTLCRGCLFTAFVVRWRLWHVFLCCCAKWGACTFPLSTVCFLPFCQSFSGEAPYILQALPSQDVFNFLPQRCNIFCFSIPDVMDYFLAGDDQPCTMYYVVPITLTARLVIHKDLEFGSRLLRAPHRFSWPQTMSLCHSEYLKVDTQSMVVGTIAHVQDVYSVVCIGSCLFSSLWFVWTLAAWLMVVQWPSVIWSWKVSVHVSWDCLVCLTLEGWLLLVVPSGKWQTGDLLFLVCLSPPRSSSWSPHSCAQWGWPPDATSLSAPWPP